MHIRLCADFIHPKFSPNRNKNDHEETTNLGDFISDLLKQLVCSRGGTGSGVESGRILRFFLDPDPESKIWEKPDPE